MSGRGGRQSSSGQDRGDGSPVRWQEAFEVYRSLKEAAGDSWGNDLRERLEADEDLRIRFESRCRWDAKLQQVLGEVAVPADLEERLLAAVGSPSTGPGKLTRTPHGRSRKPTTRRRWLAALAMAATVLLALGIWQWSQRPQPSWTAAELATRSQQWLEQLPDDGWATLQDQPREFPLPPGLGVRFTHVQTTRLDGSESAAYRGRVAGRSSPVYLFVLRVRPASHLPASPPPRPRTATNGWLVGSWQSEALVYVIRVRGTESDYRRAIGADAPLAFRDPGARGSRF